MSISKFSFANRENCIKHFLYTKLKKTKMWILMYNIISKIIHDEIFSASIFVYMYWENMEKTVWISEYNCI